MRVPGQRSRTHARWSGTPIAIAVAAVLMVTCGGRSRSELTSAAGTGATGNGGNGGNGGRIAAGAASGDAERDHFPERFATAACKAVGACCLRGALPYDAEHCGAVMEQQVRNFIATADAMALTYRPDQASLCLEEITRLLATCQGGLLAALHCDDCRAELVATKFCSATFTGDAAVGAPCLTGADCAPDPAAITYCGVNATCVRADLGGQRDEPCAGRCVGTNCFVDPASPWPDPRICDGALNLYCDTSTWLCTAELDEAQLPGPNDACGPRGACSRGNTCSDDRTCVPLLSPVPNADCADKNLAECLADNRCLFAYESRHCYSRLPCEALPMETDNERQDLCQSPCRWSIDEGLCLPVTCDALFSEASCAARSSCVWENGLCRATHCETFITPESCPPECYWEPNIQAPERCDCLQGEPCPPYCVWETGSCRPVAPPVALCRATGEVFDDDYTACSLAFPVDPSTELDGDCDD